MRRTRGQPEGPRSAIPRNGWELPETRGSREGAGAEDAAARERAPLRVSAAKLNAAASTATNGRLGAGLPGWGATYA